MNITPIINLLRAYFIENKKMLLICCLIAFGATAYLSTIKTLPQTLSLMPHLILLWIAGSFFQSSLKKNNSTHFFNLPVTAGEKFIHAVLVLFILMVVLHLVSLAGGYTGYYLIQPLFYNDIIELEFGIWTQFMINIYWKGFLFSGAVFLIFLFGSIYFKKKAFTKILATLIGSVLGISIYYFILIGIAFGNMSETPSNFNLLVDFFSHIDRNLYINIALILFFGSLTYLRLRETEV